MHYPPDLHYDPLRIFRNIEVKPTKIESGMTPEEIAEIASEKMMEIVRKQFQEAKEKYERENVIEYHI